MRTVTCHCGASDTVDDNRFHHPIGWDRVSTFNQRLILLCPTCFEQVKYHASEIYKLTGNKYVSMSSLFH
jgi:hypothetical protein